MGWEHFMLDFTFPFGIKATLNPTVKEEISSSGNAYCLYAGNSKEKSLRAVCLH